MPLDLLTKFERNLWNRGLKYIAGVDEVGRGCLAGPMVVSAVILNPKHLNDYKNLLDEHKLYDEINDSKLLTHNKRCKLNEFIVNEALAYSVVEIDNLEVDRLGISKCTQIAFEKAVLKLDKKPHHILTDAFEIKNFAKESQTNIKRGDSLSISIAAASIVAKVYRDALMERFSHNNKYEVYGFERHKGYGTEFHRNMIKKHGFSDLHRKTFKVK